MSVKLVSWNVNGIRAVSKKDEFWDWFDNTDADIINFQEVRAAADDIPKKLADMSKSPVDLELKSLTVKEGF